MYSDICKLQLKNTGETLAKRGKGLCLLILHEEKMKLQLNNLHSKCFWDSGETKKQVLNFLGSSLYTAVYVLRSVTFNLRDQIQPCVHLDNYIRGVILPRS